MGKGFENLFSAEPAESRHDSLFVKQISRTGCFKFIHMIVFGSMGSDHFGQSLTWALMGKAFKNILLTHLQ